MKPDKEEIKNSIRGHIYLRGKNLKCVAKELKIKYGRSDNVQNLSHKINHCTIKFIEAIEIFDILGWEIELKNKKLD